MRFFYIALICLFIQIQDISWARNSFQDLTSLLQKDSQNNVNALMFQMQSSEANEQKLMEQFFALPFEYRQYVFPALHKTRGISYKTRTMPGVIEWRGKLPTRLAPEVMEFAQEHLEYLSPFMYPYLMPEMWLSFYKDKDSPQKKIIPQEMSLDNKDFFKVFKPKFKTLEERNIYPLKPRDEAVGSMTKEDVGKIMKVIESFKKFGEGKEGEKRIMQIALALPRTEIFLAMQNPCTSLVERMYQTGHSVFVENELYQVNMTRSEFTNKCDRMIKAFRLIKTPPTIVQDILVKKKSYPMMVNKLDPMTQQAWETTIKMFETNPADVDAVKNQRGKLDVLLRPRYFMLGTPLFLDF